MDTSRLSVLQFCGNITSHTEVGILIDSLGNQTSNISSVTEDMRERIGETGSCLNSREGEFSTVVTIVESENTSDLVGGNMSLTLQNVGVQVLDVFDIGENESFLGVKSTGNDIFNIFHSHLNALIQFEILFMNILFIISDLDDQRDIKSLLQVFSENKGNKMTKVQTLTGGSTSCVQEERFSIFIRVENNIQVSVREEQTTLQKMMNGLSSQSFDSSNVFFGD
mmetsp:Transcript_56151/g.64089  ORF Transcript_56151/g.64089 Transcript_56151/m.64089 type:complete len:224 (-) Transcript_56151:324-995(-)